MVSMHILEKIKKRFCIFSLFEGIMKQTMWYQHETDWYTKSELYIIHAYQSTYAHKSFIKK